MSDDHTTNVTARHATLPVTTAEAKDHVRVLHDDLDTYIGTLVDAATAYCEAATGRALRISHTLTQTYSQWPCSGRFEFDRHPVKSITSITYYDIADASQTVSSANYRLHTSSEASGYVEIDPDYSRPSLSVRDDAITVTYVAGYTDIASVPPAAKQAVKLLVGHWFEHSEAVVVGQTPNEVPLAVGSLLGSLDWGCYR